MPFLVLLDYYVMFNFSPSHTSFTWSQGICTHGMILSLGLPPDRYSVGGVVILKERERQAILSGGFHYVIIGA